jgi:hypothetical protein
MLPAKLLGAYPGLVLLQDANDLLFAKTALSRSFASSKG